MNKKGFTLVELLAVIVLLSIIAVITTPVVINVIGESKEKTYNEQINIIQKAAERWGTQNVNILSTAPCVCVKTLASKGYLSKIPKNPKDSTAMNGKVNIGYDEDHKQYVYEYDVNNPTCPDECPEGN